MIEGMGFGDRTTEVVGVTGMGVRGDVSELFDRKELKKSLVLPFVFRIFII